jgi:formylglycine-generating enzyme required for sulfatase activity
MLRSLPFARLVLQNSLILLVGLSVLHAESEPTALHLDLGNGLPLDLGLVHPGTFQQGSPADEPQRAADETARTVTLTRPFYLGKFPVTRGQFARFVSESRYRTEAEAGVSGGFGWDGAKLAQRKEFTWKNPGFAQTDDHPVTLVTFNDARAFLAWLSKKTGRAFSLPSEAQWEYACRAGSTSAFPNGADAAQLDAIAWFRGNSGNGTRPVGAKALNSWELGDLPGNVYEWCEDWYAPYAEGPATDPLQTLSNLSDKPRRVLRGGSWLKDAPACRSAARYRNDPASRNADNGFRVMTFDLAAAAPIHPLQTGNLPPATPPEFRVEADRSPANETRPSDFAAAEADEAPIRPARPLVRPLALVGVLGVFIAILGALGFLAVRAARRFADRGGTGIMPGESRVRSSGSSGPIRTRIVDDGFWIESNMLSDGAILDCRYSAEGQQHQSSVTFNGAPGGQFVFTGSRPSSVAVVVQPGSVPSSDLTSAAFLGSQLPVQPPPRQRFRGDPSAY